MDISNMHIPGPGTGMAIAAIVAVFTGGSVIEAFIRQKGMFEITGQLQVQNATLNTAPGISPVIWVWIFAIGMPVLFAGATCFIECIHVKKEIKIAMITRNQKEMYKKEGKLLFNGALDYTKQ